MAFTALIISCRDKLTLMAFNMAISFLFNYSRLSKIISCIVKIRHKKPKNLFQTGVPDILHPAYPSKTHEIVSPETFPSSLLVAILPLLCKPLAAFIGQAVFLQAAVGLVGDGHFNQPIRQGRS